MAATPRRADGQYWCDSCRSAFTLCKDGCTHWCCYLMRDRLKKAEAAS